MHFQNLIDIHASLRKNWILPTNSYGLKTVATWTGFDWEHKGADGARALLWWRQWKKAGNRKNLIKKILQYNHDDCLATWAVTKWLLEND